MREFDEVGSIIEQFASEDATVVIGAVVDPDMGDEVRVTVVATGLNQARRKPNIEIVKETMQWQKTGTDSPFPADPVSPPGLGGLSGALRRSSRTEPTVSTTATALSDVGNSTSGQSYLDIPSFLRRQAD
jgi:cell division protein FtsZ